VGKNKQYKFFFDALMRIKNNESSIEISEIKEVILNFGSKDDNKLLNFLNDIENDGMVAFDEDKKLFAYLDIFLINQDISTIEQVHAKVDIDTTDEEMLKHSAYCLRANFEEIFNEKDQGSEEIITNICDDIDNLFDYLKSIISEKQKNC